MSKVSIILGLIACFLGNSGVTAVLTSTPRPTNGILTVCPGDSISITCFHNNDGSGVTRWEVSGTASGADCSETVAHQNNAQDDTCGPLTITMISGPLPRPFTSTARTIATEGLNGVVVKCFSSGLADSLIGNVTIRVLGIPTPTITSVEQVSQSVVRVSMSVADSQCVGSYLVEATPVGGSGSINTRSPTPTVDVSGLDVCQYNYSFEGSVLTPGGVQGELSSPVSFSANLSVLNGITVTINQVDPLIEWVHGNNSLYPTCITEYLIEDQTTNFNTTVSPTFRLISVTAQQLNDAGFHYCTSIQPTVTPITPMGRLETVQGSTTTVTDPDFPTPIITSSFSLLNMTVILHISSQTISNTTVPTRSYQYSVTHLIGNEETSSTINFTEDYFEFELSTEAAQAGCSINVTVTFERAACRTMATTGLIVPSRSIEGVTVGMPADTSQTVTITLPLTEYQPEQLLIISTASAPGEDDVTVMADFTSPSAQYTVTFTNLNPVTEYTFTIRIVLRSDNTVDVVPSVSGMFILATMAPSTCDGGCIAGIIILILLVISITVVIGIFVAYVKVRKEKSQPDKQELHS